MTLRMFDLIYLISSCLNVVKTEHEDGEVNLATSHGSLDYNLKALQVLIWHGKFTQAGFASIR
jgi:hypothetical protein